MTYRFSNCIKPKFRHLVRSHAIMSVVLGNPTWVESSLIAWTSTLFALIFLQPTQGWRHVHQLMTSNLPWAYWEAVSLWHVVKENFDFVTERLMNRPWFVSFILALTSWLYCPQDSMSPGQIPNRIILLCCCCRCYSLYNVCNAILIYHLNVLWNVIVWPPLAMIWLILKSHQASFFCLWWRHSWIANAKTIFVDPLYTR